MQRPQLQEPSSCWDAPPQGASVAWGVASRSPALLASDLAGGRLAAVAPTWLRWWSRWGWSGVSAPGVPAHPVAAWVSDLNPRPYPGKAWAVGGRTWRGWAGRGAASGAVWVWEVPWTNRRGRGALAAHPCLGVYGDPRDAGRPAGRILSLATGNCGCSTGTRLSFWRFAFALTLPYSVSGRITW